MKRGAEKVDRTPPADERGNSQMAGHGSKFGRKKDEAIPTLSASSAAVSRLIRIMLDLNSPAAVRLRAADRVLEYCERAQIEDFEVRIAALEEAAKLATPPAERRKGFESLAEGERNGGQRR